MPDTPTLFFDRRTRSTFPRVPLSSPAITSTVSSLRMYMSDHLGGEAEDLVELGPQFPGDGPEDARAPGVLVGVQKDQGVAVEPDVAAVLPPGRHTGPDDHSGNHVAGLHLSAREGLLHARPDAVPQVRDA